MNLPLPANMQGWKSPLKMGPTGCPETSVHNYQSIMCNIPEQRRSQLKPVSPIIQHNLLGDIDILAFRADIWPGRPRISSSIPGRGKPFFFCLLQNVQTCSWDPPSLLYNR
jgi:hypothetical protein